LLNQQNKIFIRYKFVSIVKYFQQNRQMTHNNQIELFFVSSVIVILTFFF